MSKVEQMETKTAKADGYYSSERVKPGERFNAPVSFKGKWFSGPSDKEEASTEDGEIRQPGVTGMSAKEVKAAAATMTSDEINTAISVETGSLMRKNVINLLQDELANRVGRVGGPDPAAKDIHEKDPLTPGNLLE